jgi:molecular chaperone GrpE
MNKKADPKNNQEFDEMEHKIKELTEALQRERADSLNLRRRTEEEKSKLGDFYKANVVRKLLPALDNLERALKHQPSIEGKRTADSEERTDKAKQLERYTLDAERFSEYVKGVQGVVKQFEKAMADLGVEKIKSEGEKFDPKYHEAVGMEEGEGDTEVVAEELQAGYTLGDEIVRHAFVKVKMQHNKEGKE